MSAPIIPIPGSKSIAQRALICAALCTKPTILHNVPDGDDVGHLLQALEQCGVEIKSLESSVFEITPPKAFTLQNTDFNVGHGGAPLRFLMSFLGLVPGEKILDGSERLRERPISSLVQSLKNAGADITDKLPLTIRQHKLSEEIIIKGGDSSQGISSLLLSGVALGVKKIVITGERTSVSYISLTQKVLADFGVLSAETMDGYMLLGHYTSHETYFVEPDWASVGYLAGVALLQKKSFIIPHLTLNSSQPDALIVPALQAMGMEIGETPEGLLFTPSGSLQSPGTVDCRLFPDSALTLAVLAAFCKGTTTLTGLHTLPLKECDRLTALHTELAQMGILSEVTEDSIVIHGGEPKEATIQTYDDHRMAMAFGMAQMKIPGLRIQNPEVVSKSFPGFWDVLINLK
jgi:3-phosphoshikimate 1-carboxyvinyltransferase